MLPLKVLFTVVPLTCTASPLGSYAKNIAVCDAPGKAVNVLLLPLTRSSGATNV